MRINSSRISFPATSARVLSLVAVIGLTGAAPAAAKADASVPFKGSSAQQAVSAAPVPGDPTRVFVVTEGEGHMTHLGHFTFVSPHFSGLLDFSIDGTQNFTAANGDQVFADITGFLEPVFTEDGRLLLIGDVHGTVTGGTGRFENATGTYTFHLVFDTATLASTGEFDGAISF
jgi:hypothetical protein